MAAVSFGPVELCERNGERSEGAVCIAACTGTAVLAPTPPNSQTGASRQQQMSQGQAKLPRATTHQSGVVNATRKLLPLPPRIP